MRGAALTKFSKHVWCKEPCETLSRYGLVFILDWRGIPRKRKAASHVDCVPCPLYTYIY